MKYKAILIPAEGQAFCLPAGRHAEREYRRGIARSHIHMAFNPNCGNHVEIAVVRLSDRQVVRQTIEHRRIS